MHLYYSLTSLSARTTSTILDLCYSSRNSSLIPGEQERTPEEASYLAPYMGGTVLSSNRSHNQGLMQPADCQANSSDNPSYIQNCNVAARAEM